MVLFQWRLCPCCGRGLWRVRLGGHGSAAVPCTRVVLLLVPRGCALHRLVLLSMVLVLCFVSGRAVRLALRGLGGFGTLRGCGGRCGGGFLPLVAGLMRASHQGLEFVLVGFSIVAELLELVCKRVRKNLLGSSCLPFCSSRSASERLAGVSLNRPCYTQAV